MNNVNEARKLIKEKRLFLYEVAEQVGIAPSNFSAWFRNEKSMSDERLARVKEAVDILTGGGNE